MVNVIATVKVRLKYFLLLHWTLFFFCFFSAERSCHRIITGKNDIRFSPWTECISQRAQLIDKNCAGEA